MKNINYSIVTYLVGEDYKIVRGIQEEISEITGSKKCLTDWLPHITVGDGIVVPEDRLSEIENKFQNFANQQKTIKATIKGFGGTDSWKGAISGEVTPYVIWLNVEVNKDLLDLFDKLKDAIISNEETWLPRTIKYQPHITIAFFDLDKEGYEKGLEYLKYKSLEREFEIDNISLVKCYGAANMTSIEYRRFDLSK